MSLSLSTLGAKWCGGPTSALCVSGDFSLASCSVPPVTAFSSAPAEVLQVRQNEPEHSEQGASGNCFKKCSVQLNSSANMDIPKQSLASTRRTSLMSAWALGVWRHQQPAYLLKDGWGPPS